MKNINSSGVSGVYTFCIDYSWTPKSSAMSLSAILTDCVVLRGVRRTFVHPIDLGDVGDEA